jgi:peroxiredoxin
MKQILFFLLLAIPGLLAAQEHVSYEIRGDIKTVTRGEKIYFVHFEGSKLNIDSSLVTGGTFTFKGEATISNEPDENSKEAAARLILDHSAVALKVGKASKTAKKSHFDVARVYLEPGLTQVHIMDSAHSAVIVPPMPNSGHYVLDSINKAYLQKFYAASGRAATMKLQGGDYMDYSEKYRRIYEDEQIKDMRLFVKNHPSSPVSLYVLKQVQEDYPDYDKLQPYFEPLSPTLKATHFGKEYAAMLDTLALTQHDAKAPEFTMTDQNGNPVSLSSFKGKYVLVDFWASWCGPCRKENPSVVKAYEQFKDQNFVIIGISLDEKKDAWLKAITDDKLTWTQLCDLKGWETPVAKPYYIKAIPQNFLVNPKGKIIGKNLFGDRLTNRLGRIFKPKVQGTN